MRKWYELSYKSLRETVIFLQKERKKKEDEMLFWMQYHSFYDAMKDIERLFRQNEHLKLHRSKVFRAWYKHMIDCFIADNDTCWLKMDDGLPYSKERDDFYDPNAPDWEQFDRKHYYDDDDDDNDDDDDYYDDDDDDDDDDCYYTEDSPNLKKAAEDGFMMGVGFGVADNILDNNN